MRRDSGPRQKIAGKAHGPARIVRAKRRWRWADLAEAEVLDAAERLLRKTPFRDLTVKAVMDETGLARSSFYQYFPSLSALLLRLFHRELSELRELAEAYMRQIEPLYEGPDLVDSVSAVLRRTLSQIYELYRKHGHLNRSMIEASASDPEIARAYQAHLDSMTRMASEDGRRAQKHGYALSLDTDEIARALMLMQEHYLLREAAAGTSTEQVVNTLSEIFLRSWWGELASHSRLTASEHSIISPVVEKKAPGSARE